MKVTPSTDLLEEKESKPMGSRNREPQGACTVIYGPVQSRRHGWSLGINLGSSTVKLCTWGCLYCQCGFGVRSEKIDDAPDLRTVIDALVKALSRDEAKKIDTLTFAGNSEPTTHVDFCTIVAEVLRVRERLGGKWIVNMLTNGSDLDRDDIRDACNLLDETWVKLDCADDLLFQRLNRPLSRLGGVKEHVKRILRLKQPRLQTLLWQFPSDPSLANDSPEHLEALLALMVQIKPVEIHLTTVQRLPALDGVEPLSLERLNAFAESARAAGLVVHVFE